MAVGIELPPLLPLEYCRIDRAARMLGCEVDDIVHWGEIGAIALWVRLHDVPAKLFIDSEVWLDIKENGGSFDNIDQHETFNGLSFFNEEDGGDDDHGATDDDDESPISLNGIAEGFWSVSRHMLPSMGDTAKGGLTDFFIVSPHTEDPYFKSIFLHDIESVSMTINDLWVLRPDLLKLYRSITQGEPLSNIINNTELAQKAKEREAKTIRARAPRTSHPQSEMIRALLLLHPDITEKQLKNPHKLHTVLVEMFKAAKGKAVMPDTHPNVFERWLNASTNS